MKQARCINCMKEITPGTHTCPHCGYDQQAEQISFALRPNTILNGRYLVGRVIGKGGFGITYVGFDLMLEVKVAIKEYYPSGNASRNSRRSNEVEWVSQGNGAGWDQNYGSGQDARARRRESMDRVLKEARRTAKLSGVPAVVRVIEVFQENETAYIVMDFIEGITLKDYLMKHGTLTWEECRKLLFPVMEALAQAHDLGIVHRDISPDNLMIEPDGTVKLLDLGAAVDVNANEGHASMFVVKTNFSAMEQYDENGRIGSWTDVYAFAATLYYCLTGKLMTPVLDRMRNPEVTFPNGRNIPEEVKAALRRALAIYEDERTQDMREFERELTQNSGDETTPVRNKKRNNEGENSDNSAETETADDYYQTEIDTEEADGGKTIPWDINDGKPGSETKNGVDTDEEIEKTSDNLTGSARKKNRSAIAAALVLVVVVFITFTGIFIYRADEKTRKSAEIETIENVENTETQTNEENTLMNAWGVTSSSTVFASEYTRGQIVAISFQNSLENEPEDSWDVSEEKDGTIKAWVQKEEDGYHLFIASEGKICAPKNSGSLFAYYEICTTIDGLNLLDTTQVTDMGQMFCSCRSLTELDVSGFDTSQVTDMKDMFYACSSLTELDVSGFDTTQVTDMNDMFSGCGSLTELDVSGFDTSQVTDMKDMFYACSSLTELDVSGFDTSQVTDMRNMFSRCRSLTTLTLWPDCSDSLREELYEQTRSSALTG